MAVHSMIRVGDEKAVPTASIRYADGSVRTVPFSQVRLADFAESVPWRQFRSVRGQRQFRHVHGGHDGWAGST
ncbi:hypothetical protein [Streptomyces chartreusis]|uniref:hypothetical protein n=1 Tax=Streptomyces chartreusis TaxID=1969 RepID=UPI00382271B3